MTTSTGEMRGPDPAAQEPRWIPADTFALRVMVARTQGPAGYLTIDQAADRCDLNRQSWSNWEKGMMPRDLLGAVDAISDGLGVDANWLLRGGPLARPASRVPRGRLSRDTTVKYRGSGEIATSRPRNYPDGFRRPARISRPIAA